MNNKDKLKLEHAFLLNSTVPPFVRNKAGEKLSKKQHINKVCREHYANVRDKRLAKERAEIILGEKHGRT